MVKVFLYQPAMCHADYRSCLAAKQLYLFDMVIYILVNDSIRPVCMVLILESRAKRICFVKNLPKFLS